MKETELINRIEQGLKDVYAGRGESFAIGGVVFDRFGVRFADNRTDIEHVASASVSLDGRVVVVCIHTDWTDFQVNIPLAYIQ